MYGSWSVGAIAFTARMLKPSDSARLMNSAATTPSPPRE